MISTFFILAIWFDMSINKNSIEIILQPKKSMASLFLSHLNLCKEKIAKMYEISESVK